MPAATNRQKLLMAITAAELVVKQSSRYELLEVDMIIEPKL